MFNRQIGARTVPKCRHKRNVPECHLRDMISQLERCFIKRDYETVDQETACKLLGIANAEHAHILELFEARDAVGVRDYVRDVHWNTDNAQFTVW